MLMLLLAACKETKEVTLTFGATGRIPIGFRCRDDNGRYLAARAADRAAGTVKLALLVDFIGMGGLPSCRPSEMAAFCQENHCTVLTDPPRVCFDLEASLGENEENAVLTVGNLVRQLEGRAVTDDAPHGPVVIRAIATAQRCADLGGATVPDDARLVGCAVSCPVQLEGVSGDILLDLPTLSDRCAAGVTNCAHGLFQEP